MKFEELCKKIEEKGCKLNWTEDYFNDNYTNCKTNIEITSKCGHITYVQVSNFLYCNTGVTCKKCINELSSKTRRNIENNTNIKEYNVIKAIQKFLKDKIDISIMKEGCLADIAIKPMTIDENNWLPIQVKTVTKVCHGIYSFHFKNKYENMFVIMFAIEDKRIWIMDGNDINIKRISIGKNTSIYSKYEIKLNELNEKILELYNTYNSYFKKIEELNIPISKSQKNAFEFNKYREEILNNLIFYYPEMSSTVYDCIINNKYKIQDKIATTFLKRNKIYNGIIVHLCRNRKYNKLSYKLGDNDYYWIHLPDKKGAYIIPEIVLYNNNIIFNNNNTEKINYTITLYPYHTKDNLIESNIKTSDLNNYLYFYDKEVDIEKINKIFSNEKDTFIDNYKCPIEL